MQILMSFLFGCTLTYLITVISSAIKAAKILEEATATFALMMMLAEETNAEQGEVLIANNNMSDREAEIFRRNNQKAFEDYINKKIRIMNNNIPDSHKNIIRFEDAKEMKSYAVEFLKANNRRK